jgi:gamma-glutamylcyclotransferase (GGCT)/AIG2-like uncharacterized protein YtfP
MIRMEYLFSYGTLQKEEVQLKLFGRTLQGSKDVLPGYKTLPIEITDEKFLSGGDEKTQLTIIATNDRRDRIEGIALRMTEEELKSADSYEPVGYRREKVKLASGKIAWIYISGDNDN